MPLAFADVAWLGASAREMAKAMAQAVQKHLIDRGRYLEAVRLGSPASLQRCEIEVDLPAGKDAVLQPPRRCRHVAFMAEGEEGAPGMGCVPALGVVALAASERLREAVIEAVALEHRRTARAQDVRRQVAASWFETVELVRQPLEVVFHGAEALRRLSEKSAEPLLRQVADEMGVGLRQAVRLLEPLASLRRAMQGQFARSTLVIGAEGSGKTALVQTYARQLRERGGAAPWETSAARLIQALTGQSSWQLALTMLCRELAEGDIVLYVGHLSELFEVGQYQGNSVSLGEALRDPLARGQVMLLAEATPEELARIERRSAGFSALFQQVRLPEMGPDEQERTILAAVAALAADRRVELQPDAVAELIALQRRFSPYSGFPGKGIRFFEELIVHASGQQGRRVISREDALKAFCAETGMPVRMLDARQSMSSEEIDGFFSQRLFGQPEALAVVGNVLAATKAGLARGGRPIASMLLIGPTGVGKTETAKALAEFMFGDARRMIRIDMSEYADPASVLRLLGDLGSGEGVLTAAVRRQPFSVVLFDELEKADPGFFDLLLQVLGEGRLTSGDGLTANFCGSFVLMTSNLGAEVMQRAPIGLLGQGTDPRRHFEQAVQDAFRPELFNRIDHIVSFAALSSAQRAPIFAREIALMRRREGLLERSAELTLDAGVAERLAAWPGDARYGARDVQRVLRREMLLPLAHALAPHAYVTPLAVRIGASAEASARALDVRVELLQRPVDNTALDAAEALSQARRDWLRVSEGPLYVNLLNQLFRLDNERLRHEKKRRRQPHMSHWDATAEGARARELLVVKHTAQALFADVVELEARALLALLGEVDACPGVAEWRERFFAFKKQTFHVMRPASSVCTVGLYAAPALVATLHSAWRELAELAGFAVSSRVVRLGEDTGKAAIARANEQQPAQAGRREEKREDAAPSAYVKYSWPEQGSRKSVIVGFEMEIVGPAVFDYFRREAGLWRIWTGERKSDAWVSVLNTRQSAFDTPDQVHRQHFFDERAVHRQLRQGVLSDPAAGGWRCAFEPVHEWKGALDRQFDALMDRMLRGEDD